MRIRRRTLESLRRLAERPGTKHEGIVAAAMLAKMQSKTPKFSKFSVADWPRGTKGFYNYWAYDRNSECEVMTKPPKIIQGQWWIRLRFKHLKQPRWAPITNVKGCHLSKRPLSDTEAEYMYSPYDLGKVVASPRIPQERF
jgi:hypothetical protein